MDPYAFQHQPQVYHPHPGIQPVYYSPPQQQPHIVYQQPPYAGQPVYYAAPPQQTHLVAIPVQHPQQPLLSPGRGPVQVMGGPPSPRGMGATFEHRPQPAIPGAAPVSPRGSGPAAGGPIPSLAPVPSHAHAPGSASPKSSPRGEEQKTDKFKPTPTVPYELRLLTHPERIHPSEEEILRIDGINIHAIERGHLQLIHEKTALVFHRTNIDNVVSINVGMLSINTTVAERPTLRPYRNYYVFSEGGHFFAIEIPHELPEEEVAKLEAMFYFYSRFVRMQGIRPGEETKIEKNAAGKGTGVVASVIEGGAKGLAKVFIVTGTGVAKGAKKSSDFYCKHRKAYKGPEGLTAEQVEKIETGDTFSGRIEGTTEDLVKGTGAVVLGVKNGFRKIGDKVSGGANAATKPVKDTEWYKKKQEKNEKKKKEKEAKGVKTEGGVFSGIGDIAKTGWGALNTVKDGVEKGMVAAGTGVRDASVQATRHTDGDYAAELSKQRWNAVGNVAQSFDNAYSLLKATSTWWVKAAIYTSTGVIAYDADLPNKMSGPGWWEGWVCVRGELAAGLGWIPMWAVVRTHLVALYKSHEAACTDAEKTELRPIKFSGIRKVTVGSDADTLAGRKSAIVIENAKKHYFFSTHLDQGPQGGEANHFTRTPEKEEEEKENWVNLIETLVQFQMPERVRREKESEEKKKEKEKAKKEKKEGEKKDEKKH